MIPRICAALLALLLVPIAAAQDPGGGPAPAAAPAEEAAPARVAVLGASVSAGYGTAGPLEVSKPVPLSVFMGATAPAGAGVDFLDMSDNGFFSRPVRRGRAMVDRAIEVKADAVIALDFLFWYVNGVSRRGDPRRLVGLEKGLAELDRLDCPLLLGDIPDVRHSLDGVGPLGGPMMRPSMIASEEDRAAVNVRIRAWAEERPRVRVLPLDAMMGAIVAGEGIAVRDLTWKPDDLRELLQRDLLHLTPRGTLYTALRIADELARVDGFGEVPFRWSIEAASERLDEELAAARAKKAAIDERRRKQKERREERRRKKEQEREAKQKGTGGEFLGTLAGPASR